MRGISRSITTKRNECLYKYLKPGALAQLRDSKISARSHKPKSLTHFTTQGVHSPRSLQISMVDQVPCLISKVYGPQCLKRKKLVAERSVLFLNLGPSSPVLESSDNNINGPFINVLNNDVLVVH